MFFVPSEYKVQKKNGPGLIESTDYAVWVHQQGSVTKNYESRLSCLRYIVFWYVSWLNVQVKELRSYDQDRELWQAHTIRIKTAIVDFLDLDTLPETKHMHVKIHGRNDFGAVWPGRGYKTVLPWKPVKDHRQRMQTQIRRHIMRRQISVYIVC